MHSQSFRLPEQVLSLNDALVFLNKNYNLEFSCNSKLSASCTVDNTLNYNSVEEAVDIWVENCELKYKIINKVFVFFKPQNGQAQIATKSPPFLYIINGKVFDALSKEPLPFSSVSIGISQVLTDENGFFNYQTKDSIVVFSISHVGYYDYTDSINGNDEFKIGLIPSVTKLKTIIVNAGPGINMINLLEKPGVEKLNLQFSSLIPSNTNNNIFAALRLRPGVMAAGDQSRDFFIWGSYKGQSHVYFDGITVFSSSSINENIGTVNPQMIRDVEIHKGGYQVNLGDRAGAVVNIISKSGNPEKIETDISICNQSVSGRLNIPINKKSSVQISLRSTFPDVFNPSTYNKDTLMNYYFGDLNLKYDLPMKNGDNLSVSLIANIDDFATKSGENNGFKEYFNSREQNRYQLGGSVRFSKKWKKAGKTNFFTAFSHLNSDQNNLIAFDDIQVLSEKFLEIYTTSNAVSEYYFRTEQHLPASKFQEVSFGLGAVYNQAHYSQDTAGVNYKNTVNSAIRISSYLMDNFNITKYLSLQPGIQADLFFGETVSPYWQPRINAVFKPQKNIKIKLAWGIYNQYIVEYAFVDNLNNRFFFWDIPDNVEKKPLQSMHYLFSLSYGQKYFNFKLEGFYKTIANLTQFVQVGYLKEVSIQSGDARGYGLDFYVNSEFKGQKIWLTYSLAKTEDRFDKNSSYRRALHDQRHEFKVAGLFRLKPIFFSLNYVFGSGLPDPQNLFSDNNIRTYNRLDVAFMGRHETEKLKIEAGFSLVNVLNTQNVRYDNFSNFPDGTTRFAESYGITPSVFVNISF
jgi:hypothetical protein